MRRLIEGGWPRAEGASPEVACSYCDALQTVRVIDEGASAHCRNCGERLYQNRPKSLQRVTSFSLAAVTFLLLVLIFPFLSMSNGGLKSSTTIWGTIATLWGDGGQAMAIAVALFTIVFPSSLIAFLLVTVVPLSFNRILPGATRIFRMVISVQNWVMVEVFFLGTIVSLLKLVKLADVDLGIGFWSFGCLMICLTGAMSNVDRMEIWDRIEWVKERKRKRGPDV